MSVCAGCKKGFNEASRIVPCISCRELYHWEPCAKLTASEIKVLELRKKPLLVYRCPSCDEAGKGDCIPDLNDTIKDINENITSINKNIEEIKSVKDIAVTNKKEIAELKIEVADAVSRVAVIEHKIKAHDADVVAAECQSRVQKLSNLILYDINEDTQVNDRDVIIKCLSNIQGINTSCISVRRLPSNAVGHPKPLLVKLNSPNEVSLVFQNKNVLPAGASVARDKTKLERRIFSELKLKVDEHNKLHPDEPKKIVYLNNVASMVDAKTKHNKVSFTSQTKNGVVPANPSSS